VVVGFFYECVESVEANVESDQRHGLGLQVLFG
jgi:hypothetical protein